MPKIIVRRIVIVVASIIIIGVLFLIGYLIFFPTKAMVQNAIELAKDTEEARLFLERYPARGVWPEDCKLGEILVQFWAEERTEEKQKGYLIRLNIPVDWKKRRVISDKIYIDIFLRPSPQTGYSYTYFADVQTKEYLRKGLPDRIIEEAIEKMEKSIRPVKK